MKFYLELLLLTFGLIALGVLVWRLLSRQRLLPCPVSLIWMLENRIMESVAGSSTLIERATIRPGMVVLDAGCGPGRVSVPLARYVGPEGKVVALDVQPAMLQRLRDRIHQAGVKNIEVLQAGLGEGRLPVATFDRALMVTVLGEIPERRKALEEIFTALKPNGILSITEVLPDPHYQSRKTVRQLAQQVGFQVDEAFVGARAFTFNLIKPEIVEKA